MNEQIKQKISTAFLDAVEGLPRFRKGIISNLQSIREHQRKKATESLKRRIPPKEAELGLKEISLVITFEHENFNTIQKGIKKFFPKNDGTTLKFLKSLKETEDKLFASSWHNLGYISRAAGINASVMHIDESLPSDINHVSLSFHRVLPSVACIIFEFDIHDDLNKRLCKLQNQEYLDPVIFKNLWPLNKLHHSYGSTIGKGQCHEVIKAEKNKLRVKIESWIYRRFGWNAQSVESMSYIDMFQIQKSFSDSDRCQEWLITHREWLQDYGIPINGLNAYIGSNYIYSDLEDYDETFMISNSITKFERSGKSNSNDSFFSEQVIEGIAVSSALYNLVGRYEKSIESLREKGFKNIYQEKNLSAINPKNIQELKKTLTILSRLQHEIELSGNIISTSISNVGELKRFGQSEQINLGKNTMKNVVFHIDRVKKAAEIIDTGLTNYLSVQSTYVMYKLQKWMFILSIVVTIATIVGVLSGLDELKGLFVEDQSNEIKKLKD